MDISTRPRPIFEKFKSVGGALSALAGLVAYLGTFGVMTTAQTTASSAVIAAVPGVLTLLGALLASFGVVRTSEPLVTPSIDPRVVMEGTAGKPDTLVRLVPALPPTITGLTGGTLPRD